MKILGVDPGGTTGVALISVEWDDSRYTPHPDALILSDQYEAEWQTKDSESSIGWKMRNLITEHNPDAIALERFIITQRTLRFTRQPDALYIIGGVLFLADLYSIPVVMQSASLAKTTWDNARLKDTGWSKAVKLTHARDALRHALTACVTWKPPT